MAKCGGWRLHHNVREDFRPLTDREREILELLLSAELPGIEELREQVAYVRAARWNCGCASFDVVVDRERPRRSSITASPAVEAYSKECDDLGAASQALGHSDLSTTAAIYGHYDLNDLERAMDALAKARRAEAEEPAD